MGIGILVSSMGSWVMVMMAPRGIDSGAQAGSVADEGWAMLSMAGAAARLAT